jgi:hypothetical protein
MNTRSACEYIAFAPAQPLRNWREQQPSNSCDLGIECHGGVSEYYTSGSACDFILCRSTWLLLGYVLNGNAVEGN